ncbi:MAG: hypothetical protein KKH92_00380 [Firmicutes bacterium]|nr:hypothetical protein [Bacillota bacterium]
MAKILHFFRKYRLYDRGQIDDIDFGLSEYYTGNYMRDMAELIINSIEVLEEEDLEVIHNFYEQYADQLERKYHKNFYELIYEHELINRLSDEIIEVIKNGLDLLLLVENKRITRDYFIYRAEEQDWLDTFELNSKEIHDIGITGTDIIDAISKFKDGDSCEWIKFYINHKLDNNPSDILNWTNDAAFMLFLRLN